ncbi:hypothetical protein [Evansella cellulosilytica]|uniref:Uncharacterized protein n=1 Tax=Evansella cellulosilytica (strain ATCC 21833 / DSM 2522 / FERM P-1141 / JCM 9156 / N-4) TaxID=649639 RepID=E6U1W8_EVAC2|nr:hypothetical protein [Evansella cellulosilytica]ADU31615.1 hypothetical protein Bcell_3373 [Evansella cellulosilytica DSM 2522]
MFEAIVFAITIFIGWVIFDAVKHKKVIKENVFSGLVAAIVAGIVWYVLFIIF